MPLNPNNMRVVDVARLLNSTAQGFAGFSKCLYREFNRVGFRIAASENTRNINLLKYIAWMCDRNTPRRNRPPSALTRTAGTAERNRQEQSPAGRDIAPLPEVVNPQRKNGLRPELPVVLRELLSGTYSLAWSPDHLKAIEKIETAVLSGGLSGNAARFGKIEPN